MTPLDSQTRAIQRRLREDTPFWAGGIIRQPDGTWRYPQRKDAFRGVAKIVDKRRQVVPAIAHPWQLEFDEIMERQRAAGLPVRVIILKARKLGFSTWVALKFLQRLTQRPLQYAIVTAQDVKTAGIIFDMAKFAYSRLPSEVELGLGFNIKPALIGSSFSPNGRKFLAFGEQSRRARMEGRTDESMFEIDTAGAPESGRGGTPNMLHLSEVARWEGPQATQKTLSLLNALPYEQDTYGILESTANGLNHYYRRWNNAVEGKGDPDRTGETYVPLFVPWHRDPNCAVTFGSQDARESFVESIGDTRHYSEVAEDEEALVEMFELSPEQLAWRRMMIRTQHENNVQLFKQENPATAEEAFIGSGRTVFAGVLIAKAIRDAEAAPAPVKGTLRAMGWETRRTRRGTVEVPRAVVWVPAEEMRAGEQTLEVWEHPRAEPAPQEIPLRGPAPSLASSPEVVAAYEAAQEGAEVEEQLGAGAYIVGADIAEGEANTLTEGDMNAIHVFDHRSGMQVATHASRMDVHDMPLWLYMIALYYNEALLAPECNDMGGAVIDVLDKEMRYHHMYVRKRVDKLTEKREKKAGWKTDKANKPMLIATFGEALAEGTHGLRDVRTARELTVYVYDEKARPGAQHGEHDDRLQAAFICKRVAETERPRRRGGTPRGLREPDDDLTGY